MELCDVKQTTSGRMMLGAELSWAGHRSGFPWSILGGPNGFQHKHSLESEEKRWEGRWDLRAESHRRGDGAARHP
ncbi:unnamed protein product [Merluccius merluccius]